MQVGTLRGSLAFEFSELTGVCSTCIGTIDAYHRSLQINNYRMSKYQFKDKKAIAIQSAEFALPITLATLQDEKIIQRIKKENPKFFKNNIIEINAEQPTRPDTSDNKKTRKKAEQEVTDTSVRAQ